MTEPTVTILCEGCSSKKPLNAFAKKQLLCKECSSAGNKQCTTCFSIKPTTDFFKERGTCNTCYKSSSKVVMNYNEIKKLNSNEHFELPVIATNGLNISAISLIIDYPELLLEIEDVKINQDIFNSNLAIEIAGYLIKNDRLGV